jgi:hypothetical protein
MGLIEDVKNRFDNGDFRGALRAHGWSDTEIDCIIDHLVWEE